MCLCGDLYCSSCGPMQGNSKCPVCGAWEADGGCADTEKCQAESDRMDREYAAQEEEEDRLIADYNAACPICKGSKKLCRHQG